MSGTARRKEMIYLTTHSTHFIYGFMASDILLRTILIVSKETRCRHIGYSLRVTASVLLYAPFQRQDSTYHCLCYTSLEREIDQWVHPMKDRSDDPSHHERTPLPRSYISLRTARVHPCSYRPKVRALIPAPTVKVGREHHH